MRLRQQMLCAFAAAVLNRVRAAVPIVLVIVIAIWGVPTDSRSAPRALDDAGQTAVERDGSTGPFFMKSWGSSVTGDGEFNFPNGVAVDSKNKVYVVDTNNNRIQKFSNKGKFLLAWGTSGFGDGQFNDPYGIAVDPNDNVYVSDTYNYRIQKFDSNGNFIAKWGSEGSGNGQFFSAFGIAADGAGNVYRAGHGRLRLRH